MKSSSVQVRASTKTATEERGNVPKSKLYGTPEKRLKKRSKKWCFEFWNVPKVTTTFWDS